MELLKKGSVRICLSSMAIIVVLMPRLLIAMQQAQNDAITDLYIIPVASDDNTNEKVAERTWQVLLTRDKAWCCGLAGWKFLHIPVKKLFYLGGFRSLFGQFTLEQKNADADAYRALAQLTHDRMGESTSLYHSLIRGLKDAEGKPLKPQSLFSRPDKNAQYFFIPVEYISNAALNPRKKSEEEFTLQWLTPEAIQGLEKGTEGLIEDDAVTVLKTYWDEARRSIVDNVQRLEMDNRDYRMSTLIREQGPEKRWDQLQDTLEISGSNNRTNLLDPNSGRFSIEKETYTSPMVYYKRQDACKKGDTTQRLIDCNAKSLFMSNFYKFQQNETARKQLMGTGKKILIFPNINEELVGTGAHYRGLNHQGRILMYLRDNYTGIKANKDALEIAFTAYINANSPYSIGKLFARQNLRNVFMRWVIKVRAGELFGYRK